MNSLVIYASRTGNTRHLADAVAEHLRTRGMVQLLSAEAAPARIPEGTDLVVIGGPTEAHGMTLPLKEFFDRLEPDTLAGVPAAGFDTRLRWPIWLSGSAAEAIVDLLNRRNARMVVPAESFLVTRKPVLEEGELARAGTWAEAVAVAVEAMVPLAAGVLA
jgi:flavodoxin